MPFGYPVSLELSGRKAVVIGRDAVAQGKVDPLVAVGAEVTVVADGPPKVLDRLERDGRVTVFRRGFHPQDLDGAFICVAASGDARTRTAIYREARARGVLVNVMDDPVHCDFAAPAVVRREDLVLAISTGGRSPALARRLREELEERFGPEWGALLEVVGEVREETLPLLPDFRDRSLRWQAALDLHELELLVRAGRSEEAKNRLRARLLEVRSA